MGVFRTRSLHFPGALSSVKAAADSCQSAGLLREEPELSAQSSAQFTPILSPAPITLSADKPLAVKGTAPEQALEW